MTEMLDAGPAVRTLPEDDARPTSLITSDHALAGWLVSIPVVIVLATALIAPWP